MSQRIFPITMPKWGIEMQRGTIAQWHVGVGRSVKKGEPLLDVETDKIVNTVEAPGSGVLRRILADKGATEGVGALIGLLTDAAVSESEVTVFLATHKPADAGRGTNSPGPTATAASHPSGSMETAAGEARVSPIARRIAERLGVDVAKVKGSGRNGRVSKEDVEAFAARGGGAAAPDGKADGNGPRTSEESPDSSAPGLPKRIRMTAMRETIARRLLESAQGIPHYRLAVDVDFAALLAYRVTINHGDGTVSINDLLIRATALALIRHPRLNSHLAGNEILEYPDADICVAVSTDNGLITPVVRRAQRKTAIDIGAEIKTLVERARAGVLNREEITGGTFTISNLGMFGVDRFDAIINPPQVGILAVGSVADRVIARHGVAAVSNVGTLTLSADHRVVDGAVGAAFLRALKSLIESPESL